MRRAFIDFIPLSIDTRSVKIHQETWEL